MIVDTITLKQRVCHFLTAPGEIPEVMLANDRG
jgi:hypothetical protein